MPFVATLNSPPRGRNLHFANIECRSRRQSAGQPRPAWHRPARAGPSGTRPTAQLPSRHATRPDRWERCRWPRGKLSGQKASRARRSCARPRRGERPSVLRWERQCSGNSRIPQWCFQIAGGSKIRPPPMPKRHADCGDLHVFARPFPPSFETTHPQPGRSPVRRGLATLRSSVAAESARSLRAISPRRVRFLWPDWRAPSQAPSAYRRPAKRQAREDRARRASWWWAARLGFPRRQKPVAGGFPAGSPTPDRARKCTLWQDTPCGNWRRVS